MTNLNEEQVAEKAFDIIFAFDEVLTAGGYREPITLQQIKTNMEMESHEEKLHNMIKLSKMESAKDQAASAARAIKDRQKEQARLGLGGSMQGIGNNSSTGSLAQYGGASSATDSVGSSPAPSPFSDPSAAVASVSSSSRQPRAPVKGMSLTSKNKNSVEDALMREDKLAPVALTSKSAGIAAQQESAAAPLPTVIQPLMLLIQEKVSATLSRDGMVESLEIKGGLTLTAQNDEVALCSVQLKPTTARDSVFSFNTHPKVNKAAYEKSGLLTLKEANKGFPSQRPVGILKWTYAGTDDSLVPLKINCWPEEEGRGQMNVSIEYSMDVKDLELHDVRITIPLGTNAAPAILNVDGSHKHIPSTGDLVWSIDLIDSSNTSGSLEFNIAQKNSDSFFPIQVQFTSNKLYSSVDVVSVYSGTDTKAPIVYGLTKSMSTEDYIVN